MPTCALTDKGTSSIWRLGGRGGGKIAVCPGASITHATPLNTDFSYKTIDRQTQIHIRVSHQGPISFNVLAIVLPVTRYGLFQSHISLDMYIVHTTVQSRDFTVCSFTLNSRGRPLL